MDDVVYAELMRSENPVAETWAGSALPIRGNRASHIDYAEVVTLQHTHNQCAECSSLLQENGKPYVMTLSTIPLLPPTPPPPTHTHTSDLNLDHCPAHFDRSQT